jgi:predicted MPP superfamily phosphohydrolase
MKIKFRIGLLLLFFLGGCFVSKSTSDTETVVFKRSFLLESERQNKPLKIMVISDLNGSYGSIGYSTEVASTIKHIKEIKPDIILCGGDMVAGQKRTLSEEQLKAMWAGFNKTVLQPIDALEIPFGFTMGNHDASPSFLKDRAAAKEFWDENLESARLSFVDNTHYPFYFSYIKNNVFFISWDASAAKVSPEVMYWMEEQLNSEIAKSSRLRILLGHLPLYGIVAAKNKPGEVISDADNTFDFLKKNGLDLYISGHQHAYFPAQKEGMQLFHAACLGGGPRVLLGHQEAPKKGYAVIEVPVQSPEKFSFNSFIPGTNEIIPVKSLPDSIQGFNGVMKRMDIR